MRYNYTELTKAMTTILDRIDEFIYYKRVDRVAFEKNCGLSRSACYKMGAGTRQSTYDRISYAYPELNINWLRSGEGEMLLFREEDETNKALNISNESNLSIQFLTTLLKRQEKTIDLLEKQIIFLQNQVVHLQSQTAEKRTT